VTPAALSVSSLPSTVVSLTVLVPEATSLTSIQCVPIVDVSLTATVVAVFAFEVPLLSNHAHLSATKFSVTVSPACSAPFVQ
jgi:hypothetical protein